MNSRQKVKDKIFEGGEGKLYNRFTFVTLFALQKERGKTDEQKSIPLVTVKLKELVFGK